ncbi:hypothetical protein FD754_022906, partial [Muntiacus muntjak]
FCVSLRIWAAVGEYDKPSLSAWPSAMVPLGQIMTLQCHSRSPFALLRLFKRDGTSWPELQGHLNTFTLGPLTTSLLLDLFTKPSISAHPGPLVQVEGNVTLRCHSPLLLNKFILHKKGSNGHFQRRGEMFTGGHAAADFSTGPMTSGSAGTYRCYGFPSRSPYEWSAPRDPMDIVMTGECVCPRNPLSQPGAGGPVVRSGENVTLLCSSESAFDQFLLLREGQNLGRQLAGGRGPRGAVQAAFLLGPGTPAHSRLYTCYGSFTPSPYLWSEPSDPLLLSQVRNLFLAHSFLSTTSTCPSPMDPLTTEESRFPQGHSSKLYLLLRYSIGFISTGSFLTVLVYVAIMEGEPKEDQIVRGETPSQSIIHTSFLSGLFSRRRDIRQLNLGTLSERLFTSTPLSPVHPSAEPSTCKGFNINQDRAEP